ncbi:MAG: tRNA uridine-5-carboxymethylaminomethyl(34) synthesis GTPase MnmE [Muribaculaceae bacterium]|nr:tRNA uridine-5-carboxymethylaminomethyl(34) synthesis GTPase MnmE [Muribaculaceae bacterium]MDE7111122.1 tRNA uridine-5-carboxymethylaminomethyl(34) synthesis GTPase MnmE [Muribaculaceae bacterium]
MEQSKITTICAISTPAGTGGIAVARVSGPKAIEIVDKVWKGKRLADAPSHSAHYGTIFDPADNQALDDGIATVFRAPRSFTGEDTVELSVHGSPWIQRELINLLIRNGASIANRGEFTRRAVANGKLDIAEAEAVADMIAASSRASQRIALSHIRGEYSAGLNALRNQLIELAALTELELDFSEEDVEFADRNKLLELARAINKKVSELAKSFATGRAIKEGVKVTLSGATNAGKSTLLNRLLGEEKAIVSNIHGTTRDTIEDTIEIGGILFRFIDTAGLRETDDPIERIGIDRARQAIKTADINLWIVDSEHPILPLEQSDNMIVVYNKRDLLTETVDGAISISALNDSDLSVLTEELIRRAIPMQIAPAQTVTNARHYEALLRAADSSARIIEALSTTLPTDLIAQDIRETIDHLSSITAPITTPTLLTQIFTRFCIGK